MIYIKKIMKKSKIKLINILVIIVAVMFIFIILNNEQALLFFLYI